MQASLEITRRRAGRLGGTRVVRICQATPIGLGHQLTYLQGADGGRSFAQPRNQACGAARRFSGWQATTCWHAGPDAVDALSALSGVGLPPHLAAIRARRTIETCAYANLRSPGFAE